MSRILGEHDRSASVAVGDRFVIELEANSTTGCKWRLSADETKLAIEELEFRRPGGQASGAAGKQVFAVTALQAAETCIRLDYGQWWEPSPEKTLELDVSIVDPPS